MIVPMKKLVLFCTAAEGRRTVSALRDLGCVHLDLNRATGEAFAAARGRLSEAERAVYICLKAAKELPTADGEAYHTPADALAAEAKRADLREQADALEREIAFYAPYGDFDPALARSVLARGIDLSGIAELPDPLPNERLSVLRARLAGLTSVIDGIRERLAVTGREASRFTARYAELADAVDFEAAGEELKTQAEIAYIEGWIPADQVPLLRGCAAKCGWGIAFRDPEPDELPPTLIRPPKLFRPVRTLFAGLGIAPAYTEADVSVPFMCYFTLFFAMLVGDGAYGALFLAVTLWLWRKTRPKEAGVHRPAATRSWLALMTVFSSATVGWGLLSNTWFGAGIPWCADWPTVKWLGDATYQNMMFLCFTIGASHLMLARLWNAACRAPDPTCLAEVGWAGVLFTMYFVTNFIVGIFPAFPGWAYWLGGISVACVFLFTLKPSELKTRGAELGMLPLNIMSALGDIISYVRLFAVGLASVQVAANFNDMATGLLSQSDELLLKPLLAVAMVAVLLLGHALNMVMAGLSILVHAVRLNTLEFSNHKGVSWAGYAFNPFRRRA